MTTRLYLVRHGETDANASGRTQGRRDVPLNGTGRRQAAERARALGAHEVRAVISSPAVRALETARAIAEPHELAVREDVRLRELHLGELDGLTGEEMRARSPDFLRRWREDDPRDLRIPGGETLGEAQDRMVEAVASLAREFPGAGVVVVSHNLALKALLCHALDAPLASFRRLEVGTASVSIVDARPDGPWTVVALNAPCVAPSSRERRP